MSNFIKKLFGTLAQKPWEKEQSVIDNYHSGKTLNLSKQTSAVIVIFGVSTVLFSLILTGYLYTVPPEQDTKFLFNPNLLWVNTIVLFFVTYIFTALHGLHLLGGLFFWGKVCSKTFKLKESEIISQSKSISALSLYWTFLLIVWLIFFFTIYLFNDAFIAWCKSLIT